MILNDNVMWDRLKYAVISVSKTNAPSGIDNEPWHKYIVGRCNACLVCKSRGTLEEVTEHAEKLAFDLNLRRDLRPGTYGRNIKIYGGYKKKENA
ncbi:MAG: hypothetical protein P8Y24_02395 [Gammaproteobacteria bacterium]|jgi:hypothetical protein